MIQQTIQNREEQTVHFLSGNRTYRLNLYEFRGLMYMDCLRGEDYIFAGRRVMANQWILPRYVAEGESNIRFETYKADEDEYVNWEGFNTKFRLMIYSSDEIAEMEKESEETE